jgi:SAM-dependent methyltransferase
MVFYALTISLSAFLLFQVQPIIAKMILPWFGGTSAVWSTCMLFFQLVLLLGYLYAHWLQKLRPRLQATAHTVLLAASLAALPVIPNPAWKNAAGNPSLRILALLALTVGAPYFLLSSTSPLLQAWYARTHKSGLPYRLFALSNFASMLALLSYPLVVEPNLATLTQGLIWSTAYAGFAALCAVTAWRASGAGVTHEAMAAEMGEAAPAPNWTVRLLWLGLAASASVLLLAVTNHLTQDVAAIPFLWILPLSVYLLSFIICFEAPRFYARRIFCPLLVAALVFMAWRLWPHHGSMPIRLAIALFGLALFVCCMVCHGELARLKPDPRYLTGFYVTVSLGGAVGGLFVGLAAPNLFRAYYEFPIGLILCAAVAALVLEREWSMAGARRWIPAALALAVLAYAGGMVYVMFYIVDGHRVVARNFYGLLRVYDDADPATEPEAARKFVHGTINHGQQMLRDEYRRLPVTYFCPQSGIGLAMHAQEGAPRRIGILGLGCGTLAAYGRAGDTLRIYEINPLVLDIARSQFTYLSDTAARVEVALGDGRLVLESEPSQQFDILVMDAFSGDSVPVHLLTVEALRTYFRHLKPNGILAINISNTYLDLEPVMERAANAFGKLALVYHFTPDDDDVRCFSCSWTLIMDRAAVAQYPDLEKSADKVLKPGRPFRVWTDDFSNMLSILK